MKEWNQGEGALYMYLKRPNRTSSADKERPGWCLLAILVQDVSFCLTLPVLIHDIGFSELVLLLALLKYGKGLLGSLNAG